MSDSGLQSAGRCGCSGRGHWSVAARWAGRGAAACPAGQVGRSAANGGQWPTGRPGRGKARAPGLNGGAPLSGLDAFVVGAGRARPGRAGPTPVRIEARIEIEIGAVDMPDPQTQCACWSARGREGGPAPCPALAGPGRYLDISTWHCRHCRHPIRFTGLPSDSTRARWPGEPASLARGGGSGSDPLARQGRQSVPGEAKGFQRARARP